LAVSVRVLLLTPSIRPLGARRSLVELVRHLPPGIEPLVACPAADGIYLELKDLGIATEVVPHGAWRKLGGRLTGWFRQLPALRRLVARFRPAVIHANEFHIVPQAFFGGEKKVPVCGHVRLGITPRQMANYHLGDCRRIITVSEAVAGLFAGSGLEDRVRVVYNGVDLGRWGETGGPAHPATDSLRAGGRLVVGLFGLISSRKNQLVAAEAVALANARGGNVGILFAGDAFKGSMEYGEALRGRLGQPDLSDCARWLPFQTDPQPLYRGIDVNLLISAEEGFGRTIIEAGALGIPSVGSRIGGIPELIREGETGWIVPEGDAGALAEVLLRLSADRGAVAAAGAAARRRVEEHFTIGAHTRRVVAVWEECRGAHSV
jgi:glycosyltransferase involved in cell wall biosynthesis